MIKTFLNQTNFNNFKMIYSKYLKLLSKISDVLILNSYCWNDSSIVFMCMSKIKNQQE